MRKFLASFAILVLLCGCATVLAPFLARSQDAGNANPLAVTRVTVVAGVAVMGHVITDTGSTAAATQATPTNLQAAVSGPTASGSAPTTPPVLVAGYDATNLQTFRTASLANFPTTVTTTARNSIGAQIFEKGSRWSVNFAGGISSQATASIAAEASVRHVVDCITFSGSAVTAPALTEVNVWVRDGATGAGTIIWPYDLAVSAVTGQVIPVHSLCGLNLVGTTNTAMTFEFSALVTNVREYVSFSGYNVN